ncbi:MAG TPA: S8 family serine peptidase [Dokdonella sp.]|uniref:S8 family serine peptidase n=1 Tax=Dokdonella sp. TaxID=2291710 RepID=UPI002D7E9D95|nr:S8 family serine peptidase [Dokdonella sp.]HET9032227.1 S8 family serine peptidase [Dokdonella sp.]
MPMRKVCFLAAAIVAALPAARTASAASIVVPAGVPVPASYRPIADYGSWRLFEGDAAQRPANSRVLGESHLLKFDRLWIDTRSRVIDAPAAFPIKPPSGSALQVVQFVGPLKDAWLDQVRAAGAVPVQYIDSNGYLLWADAAARSKLDAMTASAQVLQFSQPLPGFIKLGNALFDRLQQGTGGESKLSVIVQRYRHEGDAGREPFSALGLKPIDDWSPQLVYEIARFEATAAQVRQLIDLPDVFWVGEYFAPTMNDEVQTQVLRGDFNADQSAPMQPGYLPWLQSLGFPEDPEAYPILDITDSGIGDRTIQTGDPTLHRLGDNANATRMVYNQKCTINDGDVDGHGHINANIALGYDQRENLFTPGARFPAEYQRGLGINPFGRLGGTRVFAPVFDLTDCGGTNAGVIEASYAAGARISSNSWGCASCAGQYDVSSQAYDLGTRDADAATAGNQELITIFSAGNTGPNARSVGSPGNGKNMITVGASENPRPEDEDGPWNDGCQIDGSGADNAMDVIFFSSRGPAPGDRVKPDLVAPGTHVAGTQADPGTGDGICDRARPLGNVTYAASSGTSHAAPAVSGVASLSWWWIANGQGSLEFDAGASMQASPALMKAWLIAHPTYLTGNNASDSLPSNTQGFGMPNLGDMFSDTPTFLVNQNQVFGESGQVWTTQVQRVDPGKPLRVVLAWTDAPGALGTSPQVNNLDLDLETANGFLHGNHFNGAWSTPAGEPDAANNVEAIFLPPGSSEALTISVRAFNIAGDGVPGNADATDQDFALVCSNCAKQASFAFSVTPASQGVCTATTGAVDFALTTQSILGFNSSANVSVSGNPSGSTAVVSTNPVSVPGSETLTIDNLASALPGSYALAISAQAGGITRSRHAQLQVAAVTPTAPTLVVPTDNASNVSRHPLLSWSAISDAVEYRIEIARDAAFTDVIYTTTTTATSHTVASELDTATRYYWRTSASNPCGVGLPAQTFSFTTTPPPGECSAGTTATVIQSSDFENGVGAWTHSGDHDTWAISTARSHGPGQSMLAQDLAYDSDQRLVSPPITLPADTAPLSLQFWSHQTIEDRIGGCYDGALLEVSSDAGASWTQVPNSQLLVGLYRGPISRSFNNPARGKQAWCGDPQDWTRTIVDLDRHAGETVQFRFRMATDASTGRIPDGFYLDDVIVQTCVAPSDWIFADGFDVPSSG